MINLLPPDVKESITYARRNTKLLHWVTALGASLFLILAITFTGQLMISRAVKQESNQLTESQAQLKRNKVEVTQKRVQDISNSLKLAVQVLGKEVLISSLLQQIGKVMPQNSVLTGLSINKLQGGIDLKAAATDYNSATQVQVNLSDPNNRIFSKADIVNVQCSNTTETTSSKYPCTITIRAQFAKDNPFLFINSETTR